LQNPSIRKKAAGGIPTREEYKNHNCFLDGMTMERWYDDEEDILGLHWGDKEYHISVELVDGIIMDIAKDGTPLGLEIMSAKRFFAEHPEVLKSARKLTKAQG
jgi:hypothetical protein